MVGVDGICRTHGKQGIQESLVGSSEIKSLFGITFVDKRILEETSVFELKVLTRLSHGETE